MAVTELTIKLLDGVVYNNPNIGEVKSGNPSGVYLKEGGTTNIPYEQIKQIQGDLERGRIVIVGIVDDDIGVVGVPSKEQADGKVTGPAAAKKELEHELKHNIRSEPNSLLKIKENRFDPSSKEKMIKPENGETHPEAQERIRGEMSKKVNNDLRDEVKQVVAKKAVKQDQEPGRNANQEMRDELAGVAPGDNSEGAPAEGAPAEGAPAEGVPAEGVPAEGVPAPAPAPTPAPAPAPAPAEGGNEGNQEPVAAASGKSGEDLGW